MTSAHDRAVLTDLMHLYRIQGMGIQAGAGLGRMEQGQGAPDLGHAHPVPGTQRHTDSRTECAEYIRAPAQTRERGGSEGLDNVHNFPRPVRGARLGLVFFTLSSCSAHALLLGNKATAEPSDKQRSRESGRAYLPSAQPGLT